MTRKHIWEAKRDVAVAMSKHPALVGAPIEDAVNYLQRQGATLNSKYVQQCNGDPWKISEEYAENFDRLVENKERSLLARAAE